MHARVRVVRVAVVVVLEVLLLVILRLFGFVAAAQRRLVAAFLRGGVFDPTGKQACSTCAFATDYWQQQRCTTKRNISSGEFSESTTRGLGTSRRKGVEDETIFSSDGTEVIECPKDWLFKVPTKTTGDNDTFPLHCYNHQQDSNPPERQEGIQR